MKLGDADMAVKSESFNTDRDNARLWSMALARLCSYLSRDPDGLILDLLSRQAMFRPHHPQTLFGNSDVVIRIATDP